MEKVGNVKCIPKKKKSRAPNIEGVFPDLYEGSDGNMPCGLCGMKYCSVHSVQKGDWICRQKYDTWCHEVCVGALGGKQFVCGKCL
jgi:hypothetical protein